MKNAYFCIVMSLILMFCTFSCEDFSAPSPQAASWTDSGAYAPSFTGGNGTSSSPYLISNAAEFGRMGVIAENSLTTQTYFKLIKPIDLTGKTWTPVGTATHVDRLVSLDGNFNSIKGLSVQNIGWGGLFRFVSGTFKNMTFINPFIMNKSAGVIADQLRGTLSKIQVIGGTIISTNDHAGGLVVLADASTIDHCFFRGIIAVTPPLADANGNLNTSSEIGYVVNGYLETIFFVRASITASNAVDVRTYVQAPASFVVNIGGIAAVCSNNSTIKYCYFSGDYASTNNIYNTRTCSLALPRMEYKFHASAPRYDLNPNYPPGTFSVPTPARARTETYDRSAWVNWFTLPMAVPYFGILADECARMNAQRGGRVSSSVPMTVSQFVNSGEKIVADARSFTNGNGIAPKGVTNCRFSNSVTINSAGAIKCNDSEIKSYLLSNQYTIDPSVNNGFPFLKDFYWQETILNF